MNIDEAAIQKQLEQQEQQMQMEEQKKNLLQQALHPSALDRLNRIKLVKRPLFDKVSNLIVNLAQSGRLKAVISDGELLQILRQHESTETTVTFQRKKRMDDLSDNDDDDDFR